jgi:hypothetical protein
MMIIKGPHFGLLRLLAMKKEFSFSSFSSHHVGVWAGVVPRTRRRRRRCGVRD